MTVDKKKFHVMAQDEPLGKALTNAHKRAVKGHCEVVVITPDEAYLPVTPQANHTALLDLYCTHRKMTNEKYKEFFHSYYRSEEGQAAASEFKESRERRQWILETNDASILRQLVKECLVVRPGYQHEGMLKGVPQSQIKK